MTTTPPSAGTVLRLAAATDPHIAGRKAATLARLAAAGFAVPAGVVLPAAVLEGAPGRKLQLRPEVVSDLLDAIRAWGGVPLAVRSSGVDRVLAPDAQGSGGDRTLAGIAASPGRYTGTVRVIRSEAEFGRLRAGDVLVCPVTSAVWSVLFPSVGALVTDHGGMLSHPAIIAREYRVPAVVATCTGTARLRDGQVVAVDGTTGTVEVLG